MNYSTVSAKSDLSLFKQIIGWNVSQVFPSVFIQSLIRLLFLCIQGGTQSRNSTIYNYCHSFLQINNLKCTKKFSDLFGCPFARREVFHFFNLKLDTEGYLTNKADSFQPTYTCSELTIETLERRQRCQTYFTPFLVFLLFTLNK